MTTDSVLNGAIDLHVEMRGIQRKHRLDAAGSSSAMATTSGGFANLVDPSAR